MRFSAGGRSLLLFDVDGLLDLDLKFCLDTVVVAKLAMCHHQPERKEGCTHRSSGYTRTLAKQAPAAPAVAFPQGPNWTGFDCPAIVDYYFGYLDVRSEEFEVCARVRLAVQTETVAPRLVGAIGGSRSPLNVKGV